MNLRITRTTFLSLALASVTFAACGDDNEDTPDAGTNPDGGTTTPSFQAQAVMNGQVDVIDGSGIMIDPNTLAVTGVSRAAPMEPLPSGAASANYFGAVDPNAATPWWQGWTAIDSRFQGNLPGGDFHPLAAEIMGGMITPAAMSACTSLGANFADGGTVDVFGATFPVCVVSGDIVADVTLPNNHVFVLDGTINVGDGGMQATPPTLNVTLTIDAGTQIYAAESASGAALVATRGSRIVANGNAMMPVVMGAVAVDTMATNVITGDPTDLSGRGNWGGLILSGRGIVNNADDNNELSSEASPPNASRFFGGTDNADDSGSLSYVIVAETGFAFREGEEVQGLTLEAVGSGTTIDHVQVVGSDDDCTEWFGGAVNVTHLICLGANDDSLDIDSGYVGNIQFALIRLGTTQGDRGIESDNNGTTFDLMPVSAPNIANITVLGNSGRGDTSTRGALHREGFAGKVYRSVFTDDVPAGGTFEAGCLDIDDVLPMGLRHYDSVFNCSGGTDNLSNPDDE